MSGLMAEPSTCRRQRRQVAVAKEPWHWRTDEIPTCVSSAGARKVEVSVSQSVQPGERRLLSMFLERRDRGSAASKATKGARSLSVVSEKLEDKMSQTET